MVFTDKGGHDGIVRAVLCLENGNVVSGGDDKKIIIWNENKDRLVRMDELIGHNGPVVSLYQIKEKNLISGDMYSVIYIWDIPSGTILQELYQNGEIIRLYQPSVSKGKLLCSISSDNHFKVWERKS